MIKAMEHPMRPGLTVALFILVFGSAFATAEVDPNSFNPNTIDPTDSTTWERCYEANVLPVQDGWVDLHGHDPGGTNVGSIVPFDAGDPNGGSYLHAESDDVYQGFGWHGIPGDLDPATNGGISVEWRMRPVAGQYPFFYHLFASGSDRRWLTNYVSPTSVTLRDSDDDPSFAEGQDPNETGFLIYRVTCDNVDWRLYRFKNPDDPNRAEALITAPVFGAHSDVALDGSGYKIDFYGITADAIYDIDYIRWTNYGALLPGVPEVCGDPGTLYQQADFDQNCYVDAADLRVFAAGWLNYTDPINPECD